MRKIESLRIDHDIPVEQMAHDFGVTIATIYNWQKSQPNLPGELIIKLCYYFDVSSDDLLGVKKKVS